MRRMTRSRPITRRATLQAALGSGAALLAARAGHPPRAIAQPADLTAALDSFIRQALQTYGVPGAAVAVVSEGRTIFLRGYGVRRLGEAVMPRIAEELGAAVRG